MRLLASEAVKQMAIAFELLSLRVEWRVVAHLMNLSYARAYTHKCEIIGYPAHAAPPERCRGGPRNAWCWA